MARVPGARAPVLGYVYAMLAVVVIVVVATLVFLYAGQRNESATRDRVQYFHFESSAQAQRLDNEARALLDTTQRSLARGDSISGSATRDYGTKIGYEGILHSMSSRLERLAELQDRYQDEAFLPTMKRLGNRFERVESSLRTAIISPETAAAIEAMAWTIRQFDRLHTIAADNELQALSERQNRRPHFLTVLSVAAFLGALAVLFLMSMLRGSLSQQKRAEQELAEAQERLHNIRKLDALGQLVGGVAHDFNNLLTAILGNAELLQAMSHNDEAVESSLQDIRAAGKEAAALTQQLLAFSRGQKAHPEILDFNAILRDMEPYLRQIVGADIELHSRYSHDLGAVELDQKQLQQVIVNLASNARDAMPDGGVLSLATENALVDATDDRLPPGDYVRFTVADNGVGMDDETRRRLFEPFFTTRDKGESAGLGLSTVHGIVADSKGHIFVQSLPGEGSRFDIYLPCAAVSVVEAEDGETSTEQSGSQTILIVDDDVQILRFVEKGLSSLGYHVLTTSRATDALDLCESFDGKIDVIVSDVVMSGMNGSVFMERARRLRPDAVAIFMSGYTDVLWRNRREDGVPLVTKPFELQELTRLFRNKAARLDETGTSAHEAR